MRAPKEKDSVSWKPGGVDAPGTNDPGVEKKDSGASFLRELPILIVLAVIIALVVKTFVVQAFFIPSGSMEDTLLINDRVLVSKFVYDFSDPKPGQIVVFVAPSNVSGGSTPAPTGFAGFVNSLKESLGLPSNQTDFIKRVVATAGQTVEIKGDGFLYVNNVKRVEPFRKDQNPMPAFGPVTVPPNDLFVMGDNRFDSEDSRIFGAIPKSTVVGEAFLRIWPVNRFHFF